MMSVACLLLCALAPVSEPVPFPSWSAPASDDFPPLEYTYVEANYVRRDSDLANETLDGWDLTGSLELPMNFFLQATGHSLSGDTDLSGYRIGAGWHFGLMSRLDAYAILGYEHLKLSGSGNDDSEDSASGEIGARLMITHRIEANARLLWADLGDNDKGAGLGARFYIIPRFSVGARYDRLGDDDVISAGLRFEL